jgi:hypothetical protein
MKKTVVYNGENIKVIFTKENFEREILGYSQNGYPNHSKGTHDFVINSKKYTINWESRRDATASNTFKFEGFKCGDSEKKMIEFIIAKYGI